MYRRPANKGMRCQRWQRVSGRGGRRLLRCAEFHYPKRRFQMGYRPGHVPANRGATCLRRQRVWSPWYNKKVWRCAKYGPGGQRPYKTPFFKRLFLLGPGGPRGAGRGTLLLPRGPAPRSGGIEVTPGRIPLSLPSMERQVAGRTPR